METAAWQLKTIKGSKVTGKRAGPYECDWNFGDQLGSQRYRTTVSKDGKVLTNDGTMNAGGKPIAIHQVFDRVK